METSSRQHTLLVLYGSETGNAQDVAERIAREAARRHYAVNVLAMDDYEVTELPNAQRAVFVTSTMGQGDPPSNMKLFWRFLLRKNLPHNSLRALAFAVFGLGDSHYQKYNATAKKLQKRLEGLGARPLTELGLGDDQHPTGHEATLDPWLKRLWATLRAECPLQLQPPLFAAQHNAAARVAAGAEATTMTTTATATTTTTTLTDPPDDDDEFVAELDPCRFAVDVVVPTPQVPPSTSTSTGELCAAAAELDRVGKAAAAVDPKILRGGGCGVEAGGAGAGAGAGAGHAATYGQKNPLITTVVSNHSLTAEGASNEVRHVVFDAAAFASSSSAAAAAASSSSEGNGDVGRGRGGGGDGVEGGGGYAPGDCLAVMPLGAAGDQDPEGEGVLEVLRRAGLAPDAWVRVSPAAGGAGGGGAFVSTAVPARTLVAGALDIASASPRRYFFEVAAHFARDENERERLRYFASAEGRDDLYRYNQRERRTVLEFLSDFKSVEMPLQWMLQTAPRLQPRLFSISSSPLAHPGTIHATVSLVAWTTHYGRPRRGLCSNMLAAQSPGARVAVWLTKGTLRLPPPATPLIIVCTGSGVAPFRSFVHERAAQRAVGATLAPTLVFFGCRRRSQDFLYEEEWERFASPEHGNLLAGDLDVQLGTSVAAGTGTGTGGQERGKEQPSSSSWFVPAFSRDGASKEYVTHGIRSEARRVWGLILAGAHVFVAGSSGKMPEDVLEAFRDVAQIAGGMDAAEAKRFFARMDAVGRYTVEAW